LQREFRRYDLKDWSFKEIPTIGFLSCSRCLGLSDCNSDTGLTDAQYSATTPEIFESCVGSSPLKQVDDVQTTMFNLGLTGVGSKSLTNCSHRVLSRHIPALGRNIVKVLHNNTGSQSNLSLDDLSTMLRFTAGIRSQRSTEGRVHVRRWAATAGNLGSVELFVAVRHIDGLEEGIYFYQAHDHSLACFEQHGPPAELRDFVSRIVPVSANGLPNALVIFTAAFHRVRPKYGHFAYRLIHLDAGVCVSQLHTIAGALEVRSVTYCQWPDDLIERRLNLSSYTEQVSAVVGLHCDGGQMRFTGNGACSPSLRAIRASNQDAKRFAGLTRSEVTRAVFLESRLIESDLREQRIAPTSDGPPPHNQPLSEAVQLPAPHDRGRSVGEVLVRRRSVRRYATTAITLDQLSTVLHCAKADEIESWVDPLDVEEIKLLVLARRVEGLASGLYHYAHEENRLCFRYNPLPNMKNIDLFWQKEFSSAPLVVFIVGNLASACARLGSFGHRRLLLRSGTIGHRLWMAGIGLDLSGCLIAGVNTKEVRKQFRLAGSREHSLFAVAVGHSLDS
jgi:SagB-type dehydrogenase family enzyme